MPGKKMTFDTVREIGRTLPGVEEGTAYGSPALTVRGRMFACVPTHRSAEPDSLVLRIGFDERDDLIAADPATYYLKDHYAGYPAVLVRLNRIHRDALRDLLLMGQRFVASREKRRTPKEGATPAHPSPRKTRGRLTRREP